MTHDSCGSHQIFPKKETTKVYTGSVITLPHLKLWYMCARKWITFKAKNMYRPCLCFKVHNLATTKGESVCDYIQQEARNDCLERR